MSSHLIFLTTLDKNENVVKWGKDSKLLYTGSNFDYLPQKGNKFFINLDELDNNFDLNDGYYLDSLTKENFQHFFYYGKVEHSRESRKNYEYAKFIVDDIFYFLDEDIPYVHLILKTAEIGKCQKEKHYKYRNTTRESYLTDTNLSIRVLNCLRSHCTDLFDKKLSEVRVKDLENLSIKKLLSIRNFGKSTVREVKELCDYCHIELAE